jgi:hypothetical protein
MSLVNVNAIEPSTGTDITLGASGDTITIPSGATITNSGTATGFGVALTGSTNNTVATVTGADAIAGEAKLLFDPAKLTIGNASEEDTSIVFDGHAQDYYIGLDDTDDDLKIGLGSAVGTTAHMVFDETGAILKPLQPAFLSRGSNTYNVTGDGTAYTMLFDGTQVFDQNSDFDETTGLFTAPVTGRYMFFTAYNPEGITSSHTSAWSQIQTSNDYAPIFTLNPWAAAGAGIAQNGVYFADMDASDTAKVVLAVQNGSKVVDITTAARFGGWLVC